MNPQSPNSEPQNAMPEDGGFGNAEAMRALGQPEVAQPDPETEATNGEQDIRQTLAERHPDWPPVEIEFYFGPHETKEDFAGLKDKLEGADIYLYEDYTGNRKSQKYFQKVADKKRVLPGAIGMAVFNSGVRGTQVESMVRALYGSRKVVESIDIVEGDPVGPGDVKEAYANRPWEQVQDFQEAMAVFDDSMANLARVHEAREHTMEERLEQRLEEIFADRPELLDKQSVKVLSTLGTVHTGLYMDLKGRGEQVSRSFAVKEPVHSYQAELVRTHQFGREPSRDLIARTYLEDLVWNQSDLQSVPGSLEDYIVYMRELVGKFDEDDVEGFHTEVMNGARLGTNKRPAILLEMVDRAGMGRFPTSPAELSEKAQEIRERRRS